MAPTAAQDGCSPTEKPAGTGDPTVAARAGGSRIGARQDKAVAPVADAAPRPVAAVTPTSTALTSPAAEPAAAAARPDEEMAPEEDEAAGDTVDHEG
jgi:hypothetical protein